MKKLITILLTILMVFTLAACSGGENETADDEGEKQQWGFIFEQLTNPNYVTMSGVAKDYCAEKGIDIQIVDGQESADTMIAAAENMATLGYQVILLSPMDVNIASSAADAAKAINPDIIIVNSAIQCDECDYSLLQDDYTSGLVCAEEAAKFAKENNLNQVFVIGYPRDQALIDREDAFIAGMGEYAPEVEILYQDWSNVGGDFTAASENIMTTYPDCKMAYAISDVLCGYFYETLQASDEDTSKWAVYAVDGTEDGVGWIYEDKGFRGTADTGTLEIPKGLIDVALRIQAGEDPSTITVSLPVEMITAENVDAYAEKIGYEK